MKKRLVLGTIFCFFILGASMLVIKPNYVQSALEYSDFIKWEPAPPHQVQYQPRERSLDVIGYYAEDWPQDHRALDDLNGHIQDLQSVVPFAYGLDDNGHLTGHKNQAITVATQKHLDAYLLVHNYRNEQFDKDLIHKILTDPSLRQTSIQSILDAVRSEGYKGVHIDFESVTPTDRAVFTDFMRELYHQLHSAGLQVGIAVPAETKDDPANGWSGAFDYAAINQSTDVVVVMTYDESWLTSKPGPIASYNWVEKVMRYAASQIAPEKLYMGVAAYGYNWSTAGNKAIMEKAVTALASSNHADLIWDSVARENHFGYTDNNGAWHDVWSETPQGLEQKMNLARELRLKGIAIWRLGFLDQAYWDVIHKNR